MRRFCAVIPAAGRGSRLGAAGPKLLVPVDGGRTIWDLLQELLEGQADRVHVVLSPSGAPAFEARLRGRGARRGRVTWSVQAQPRGMGDAVFGAWRAWREYENVLVLWGDQALLSKGTLRAVVEAQRAAPAPALTLPLVRSAEPYVEYRFDAAGRLAEILQSREGDECRPGGWADVGLFALSTRGLRRAWREHLRARQPGRRTGELNFLPFLAYLARGRRWRVARVEVGDPDESLGVNTPEDLERLRSILSRRGLAHG